MSKDLQSLLSRLAEKAKLTTNSFLNEQSYFLAIESAFNMIIITDQNAVIQYANPAVERITGFSRDEIIGKTPNLWGRQMSHEYYRELWETILGGRVFDSEITNKRKNSDSYIAKITISPIQLDQKIIGFIGTEEDITLQRELLKEKEEFVSMASHQLRTPLGSMKWSLELLREKKTGIEKELAELAETNQAMIDMVNRLLQVMRIKDNRLELRNEKVVINDIIKSTVAGFTDRLVEKQIKIDTVVPDKKIYVSVDKGLIQEIISNLIDNAIKYSGQGTTVRVGFSQDKDSWSVSVKDQGIGIPEEDLPNITNKYYRSKNAQATSGTGLGLYIVNTYIQKMKGKMSVNSETDKGTEIICTFPV